MIMSAELAKPSRLFVFSGSAARFPQTVTAFHHASGGNVSGARHLDVIGCGWVAKLNSRRVLERTGRELYMPVAFSAGITRCRSERNEGSATYLKEESWSR